MNREEFLASSILPLVSPGQLRSDLLPVPASEEKQRQPSYRTFLFTLQTVGPNAVNDVYDFPSFKPPQTCYLRRIRLMQYTEEAGLGFRGVTAQEWQMYKQLQLLTSPATAPQWNSIGVDAINDPSHIFIPIAGTIGQPWGIEFERGELPLYPGETVLMGTTFKIALTGGQTSWLFAYLTIEYL